LPTAHAASDTMFDSLSEKLEGALQSISGQGKINELNVAETMREIRRALLNADVNYQVARDFTDRVKEKATGEEVLTSVTPGQQLTKIVYDEITHFLGDEFEGIEMADTPPTVILVAGLQGSGKTTFCAKLAKHFVKEGNAPLLAAADVYRPAAVDQLRKLASEISVPVYSVEEDDGTIVQDAVRVADEAVDEARRTARDIVIIDTAGRMHIDERMMQEVTDIKSAVDPDEILFVVDSMTGQDAVNTAKEFNEQLDYDGVVLTKLDGDTRGGAALSIRSVVEKPIKFASTGEKLDALTPFYPDRMAQRILGMGDVVSFVERAQEQYDEKQAQKLQRKIRTQDFDLQDFYDQLQRIKKMGPLKDLIGMLPGVGQQVKDLDVDDDAFKHIEAMIMSMTPEERANPQILNGTRRRRIAHGSGMKVRDVNQLIKQFREMKKMMKTMSKLTGKGGGGMDMKKLMNRMGMGGGGGGKGGFPGM
jgi:signal recognition particle subunit SRP54